MKLTLVVISKSFEIISSDGEKSSGHDGRRVRRPDVGLLGPILFTEFVPLEVHAPVHQTVQVLLDETVVQGRVVDGVDHGGDDQLKENNKIVKLSNLKPIVVYTY